MCWPHGQLACLGLAGRPALGWRCACHRAFDHARTELNVRQDSRAGLMMACAPRMASRCPRCPMPPSSRPPAPAARQILVGLNFGAPALQQLGQLRAGHWACWHARSTAGTVAHALAARDLPALSRGEIRVLQQALNDPRVLAPAVDSAGPPRARACAAAAKPGPAGRWLCHAVLLERHRAPWSSNQKILFFDSLFALVHKAPEVFLSRKRHQAASLARLLMGDAVAYGRCLEGGDDFFIVRDHDHGRLVAFVPCRSGCGSPPWRAVNQRRRGLIGR